MRLDQWDAQEDIANEEKGGGDWPLQLNTVPEEEEEEEADNPTHSHQL